MCHQQAPSCHWWVGAEGGQEGGPNQRARPLADPYCITPNDPVASAQGRKLGMARGWILGMDGFMRGNSSRLSSGEGLRSSDR